MQPKADMVPKECGFNQSEAASCLCARVALRIPGSPVMARDGELIQTQYFCHHAETICHPNSSYVTQKLYETLECGCSNNTIFQNGLFSRFLPSTYLTRFNKIAIQGAPQMAVDKEAISLSRVYSYYSKCNLPLFYV